MIDLSKEYETKCGYKVKLSVIEDGLVHGLIKVPDSRWQYFCWAADSGYGRMHPDLSENMQLIEKEPEVLIECKVWFDDQGLWYSQEPTLHYTDRNFGSIEIKHRVAVGSHTCIGNETIQDPHRPGV